MDSNARISGWSFASLGLGVAYNLGASYVFFYVVYPFAIWKLGILRGGIVMTSISVVLCYTFIYLYDWSGRDWFGIEALKARIRGLKGRTRIGRFLSEAIKRSGPLALVLLSIKFDPFVTTVYLRQDGRKFGGLGRREWLIFLSSAAIGNGYWLFVMFMGGSLFKYLGL